MDGIGTGNNQSAGRSVRQSSCAAVSGAWLAAAQLPILAPFAVANPQNIACAVDITDLKMRNFGNSEFAVHTWSPAACDGGDGALSQAVFSLSSRLTINGSFLSPRGNGMRSMATFWFSV